MKNPGIKDNDRVLIWYFPHQSIPKDDYGINYKTAIRQDEWKLIYNMRDGSRELYNLKADIGEQKNLAAEYPESVKVLVSAPAEQFRQWKAPMPDLKADLGQD